MKIVICFNKSNTSYISKVEVCCDRLSGDLFDVAEGPVKVNLVLDTDEDVQLRLYHKGEFIKTIKRCFYCGETIETSVQVTTLSDRR